MRTQQSSSSSSCDDDDGFSHKAMCRYYTKIIEIIYENSYNYPKITMT